MNPFNATYKQTSASHQTKDSKGYDHYVNSPVVPQLIMDWTMPGHFSLSKSLSSLPACTMLPTERGCLGCEYCLKVRVHGILRMRVQSVINGT